MGCGGKAHPIFLYHKKKIYHSFWGLLTCSKSSTFAPDFKVKKLRYK